MKKTKKMKKVKKWRINEDVVLRNVWIISTVISVGFFIHKVATCGIAWMSTIGYFD